MCYCFVQSGFDRRQSQVNCSHNMYATRPVAVILFMPYDIASIFQRFRKLAYSRNLWMEREQWGATIFFVFHNVFYLSKNESVHGSYF